jgi:hypothetical protein
MSQAAAARAGPANPNGGNMFGMGGGSMKEGGGGISGIAERAGAVAVGVEVATSAGREDMARSW